MYSAMQNREVLQADVTAPSYSTRAMGIVPKMQNVPFVDAGAYRTTDGKQLTLFLINRSARRDAVVQIDPGLESFAVASIRTLTADSYLAENSPEVPDNVVPRAASAPQSDPTQPLNLTLSKHSLTVIELSNAK